MPFKSASIRRWKQEWRQSDWRETIPLSLGRECPECLATVCGGASWRAHEAWHDEQLEWRRRVNSAIRQLAAKAGMTEIRPAGEDDDEGLGEEPVSGYVLGNGPLPAETRGGGE